MPKEGTSNNKRTRVSPYPLRSSRSDNVPVSETEGPEQWNDVQCAICFEPPHNAMLLHCSSYHTGCRSYICDTSARHSNCLKQFRKNHKSSGSSSESPNCPLCRGKIYEMVKVTAARRFMNAKPRSCSMEGCDFIGTYAQLNIHLKDDHAGDTPPKVDPTKQQMWEEMERETEYNEVLAAAGLPLPLPTRRQSIHALPPPFISQDGGLIQVRLAAIVGNPLNARRARSGFEPANYAASLRPRMAFRVLRRWPRL